VELLLNSKSLGRKQNPVGDTKQRNQIRWDNIIYEDGKLEAVAYNNGKPVARHKIETTGKAVKLKATLEDNTWQADGTDLMHIRIEAIDSKGRRVPMAQDELKFEVEGDAKIVAVSNGDINSEELNVTKHRRLWNGSALVILRAGTTSGKVTLNVTSDTFKPLRVQNILMR
jgi:beta-galactosidase